MAGCERPNCQADTSYDLVPVMPVAPRLRCGDYVSAFQFQETAGGDGRKDIGVDVLCSDPCLRKGTDPMNLRPLTAVLAMGLVALTTLVLCDSSARAAGCGSCHYRPGNCPKLTNEGSFGYYPTLWQLWPGPLDPSTTYPAAAPAFPTTMPPADQASQTLPAPVPSASDKLPSKPAAQSAPARVKDKAENAPIKPAPVSTYQLTPNH
jgi:hypothetical protein